jgi:hypothetical protein
MSTVKIGKSFPDIYSLKVGPEDNFYQNLYAITDANAQCRKKKSLKQLAFEFLSRR